MSPIEHYFENLLDMGSDIKGDPNKNALSKEVQEAVEICADYIKYNHLLDDTKADMVAMLEGIKNQAKDEVIAKLQDIRARAWYHHSQFDDDKDFEVDRAVEDIVSLIDIEIGKLKENKYDR
jgi:hypothetical protein